MKQLVADNNNRTMEYIFSFPAHISRLNMFNHPTKTTQVRIFRFSVLTTFSWTSLNLRRLLSKRKLDIRISYHVTFKRIWHYISNVYLRTSLFDSLDNWHKILSGWEVRKSFQNYSALTLRIVFLWVTHLFLVKRLFDHSTRIDNFPYFRIQPQTMRLSWE